MMTENPIDLLFGGMEKLGPGTNADTLFVLDLLPKQQFQVVVDAGCGTGRQTLALAKALNTIIQAVDSHEAFLVDLVRRARDSNIEHLVAPHCMDMEDIPKAFSQIDLLWSEGAAYSIGFSNALQKWASVLVPGGHAVVSELSWLNGKAPDAVKEFFRTGYPDMRPIEQNLEIAKRCGYQLVATHVLPPEAWTIGYYDILAPRANGLIDHKDSAVRDFALETIREIEIFEQSQGSYGYVFFVLRRTA